MMVFHMLMLAASFAVVAGFICRLDAMHFRTDEALLIAMHVALAAGAFSAGVNSWYGVVDKQDVCVLAAGACWLLNSLPAWRHRARAFADTRPAHLEAEQLPRISGGAREPAP